MYSHWVYSSWLTIIFHFICFKNIPPLLIAFIHITQWVWFFCLGYENVLEPDSDDECTSLSIYLIPSNGSEVISPVNFILQIF